MEITIHRGTQEIGGSCVQLTSGGRSILLDAGSPLGDSQSHVDLSQLDFTDVFISHPHQDHYGLIDGLAPSKTVHIGGVAKELISATRTFLGNKPLPNSFNSLKNRMPVETGPFKVTPYLMDHSSVDAFGFLVEAEGKRVYYSGDFRAHGRRERAFQWFVKDPPRDVDVLLMEGTMMGRDNIEFKNEKAVTDGMIKILDNTNGPCFLISSGQHIDRLSDAYGACMAVKPQRTLVTDPYTAYILYKVSTVFPSVPSIATKPNVKVLTEGLTYEMHKRALAANPDQFQDFLEVLHSGGKTVDFKDVLMNGHRYFLKVSNFKDMFRMLKNCEVSAIYSQWKGYLEERHNPEGFTKFNEIRQFVGEENFHIIHTSGHAVREDLQAFAEAIKPKILVPIHTEHGDRYEKQFAPIEVKLLDDSETIKV